MSGPSHQSLVEPETRILAQGDGFLATETTVPPHLSEPSRQSPLEPETRILAQGDGFLATETNFPHLADPAVAAQEIVGTTASTVLQAYKTGDRRQDDEAFDEFIGEINGDNASTPGDRFWVLFGLLGAYLFEQKSLFQVSVPTVVRKTMSAVTAPSEDMPTTAAETTRKLTKTLP